MWKYYVYEVLTKTAPNLQYFFKVPTATLESPLISESLKEALREHDSEFAKALRLFNKLHCYKFVIKTYDLFKSRHYLRGKAAIEYA